MSSTNQKPFSYASLNCVLKRFDANTRIMLTLVAPCIASTDKKHPLKINNLVIYNTQLDIDGVSYATFTEPASSINRNHDCFSGQWDSPSRVVKPGDIVIQGPHIRSNELLKRNKKQLMDKLRFKFMKALEHFLDGEDYYAMNPLEIFTFKSDYSRTRQQLNAFFGNEEVSHLYAATTPDRESVNHLAIQFPKAYRKMLNTLNTRVPLNSREWLIALTWPQHEYRYQNWSKVLGKVQGTNVALCRKLPIKVRDGFKKLSTWILGGRSSILVKRLDVRATQGIVGLPPGLKLHVRELNCREDRVFEFFEPSIDERSFPLDTVCFMGIPNRQTHHEKLFATKVIRLFPNERGADFEAIANIDHPNIEVQCETEEVAFDVECQSMDILRRNTQRKIGSVCTIVYERPEQEIESSLRNARREHPDIRMRQLIGRGDKPIDCLIWPMTETKELVTYGEQCQDKWKWNLKMEVMPVGVAVPKEREPSQSAMSPANPEERIIFWVIFGLLWWFLWKD